MKKVNDMVTGKGPLLLLSAQQDV